jgi:DNA-binding NarL/FixJ family response regulator
MAQVARDNGQIEYAERLGWKALSLLNEATEQKARQPARPSVSMKRPKRKRGPLERRREKKRTTASDQPLLTSRERQIARFASEGLSNRAIAKNLGIGAGTVKVHLHRIFEKLGIRSRSALRTRLPNTFVGRFRT